MSFRTVFRAVVGAARQARPVALAAGFGAATAASAPAQCGWFSSGSSAPKEPPTQPFSLFYFPVPGTPGEVCRVLLALSGKEWNDEVRGASTKPSWPEMKATTKWGQMPVIKGTNGSELTQSRAMARYLSREVQVEGSLLYPADAWLAFQVDELIDTLEDVRVKIVPTFSIKDQAEKEAARAALFATDGSGALFEGFKQIEQQLPAGGHMVGSSFTLADFWAYVVVNQFRAGFLDGVPATGWLEKLPKLNAVVSKAAAVPAVKAYYTEKSTKSKLFTAFVSS